MTAAFHPRNSPILPAFDELVTSWLGEPAAQINSELTCGTSSVLSDELRDFATAVNGTVTHRSGNLM